LTGRQRLSLKANLLAENVHDTRIWVDQAASIGRVDVIRRRATVDRDNNRGGLRTVAQKTTIHYLDDLDQDQAAQETVLFGIDGATYSIDLSAEHAATLRADLATWIEHAHRASARTTTRPRRATRRRRQNAAPTPAPLEPEVSAGTGRDQAASIREWARNNGHQVSGRGRIPAAVLAAFHAATDPIHHP